MNEPASDVIAARARAQGTLMPTLAWSVAAHVAIVAAIWLAPASTANQTPRTVMTINLGGAPGPRAGGLTQTGRARRAGAAARAAEARSAHAAATAGAREAAALPSPKAAPARPARSEPAPAATLGPRTAARGQHAHRNRRARPGVRPRHRRHGPEGHRARGHELLLPGLPRVGPDRDRARAGNARPGATGVTTVRFRILRAGTFDSVSIVQSSGNPHARRGGSARHLARTDAAAAAE